MVKNMKLEFRPDSHLISNTGGFHVFFRFDRYAAWVLVKTVIVRLSYNKDSAYDAEGGNRGKGIINSGTESGKNTISLFSTGAKPLVTR